MTTPKTKPTILIVDDEKNTREGLRLAFRRKYEILLAENAEKGLEILAGTDVDVVVTDLRMPGLDGLGLTREVTSKPGAPLVILFTAYGTIQTSLAAIDVGAYDYLSKPVNLEQLENVIERGLAERKQQNTSNDDDAFADIVGDSAEMAEIFTTIRRVANARTTVLLTGESGTGKELFAQAVHNLSPRRAKPFVVIHCAALNQNLLESELFGHEKGAFTSAVEKSKGRFELADQGTLFLDEIGEIDASTQVKLLRVLETRTFERVGGSTPIEVDVRLVAATNRDLKAMVAEGTFREDLYYRLHVVNIQLPPLRQRPNDIPTLLRHFLNVFARENGKDISSFAPEAMNLLQAYSWPGNVRELRNCVERMVVMGGSGTLTLKDVPADIRTALGNALGGNAVPSPGQSTTDPETNSLDMAENKRNLIIQALKQANGNRTEAAKILGISRRTIQRKIVDYDIKDI